MFRREDPVARAQRLFDRGSVEGAAWILWEERRRATLENDCDRIEEIDQAIPVMRERLKGDSRLAAFDAHLRGAESALSPRSTAQANVAEESVDVTALSLGIALVGAGLMVLAVFLPQFESNTFARIEKNTLIQNGDGWWFILLAVIAAGAAYRAYRDQRRSFASVVVGVIGIGIAFYYGTSDSHRKLCSLSPGFGQHCTLGTPGIGIYAAGVGGLLILIGGWQIFRSELVVSGEYEGRSSRAADKPAPGSPGSALAARLRTLDQLLADGVISDAEHAQRRAALLNEI